MVLRPNYTFPYQHGRQDTNDADWMGDNGELTLAGDWLTQSGLLTPPFSIEALPGRIILRAEPDVMLA
ncbi:SymE family type I addiction module toxin [Dickeya chrysanthemi]|uniref:SymE family type I addiction module toxin n=1 Tax=Dickeya chrysanthemi TaxID=556 RepID=UPI00237941A0|nr:SymE family type I addiction module toxin [Dickeya chrysanthemi]